MKLPPALLVALALAPLASGQTSGFTSSTEGWVSVELPCGNLPCPPLTNPPLELGAFNPSQQPSGGNPGGWLRIVDPDGSQTQGGAQYWRAPAKFLGNKLSKLGGSLSFAQIQTTNFATFSMSADVLLVGNGLTLGWSLGSIPNLSSWKSTTLALAPGTWTLVGTPGVPATAANIASVLSNLQALYIRGEYQNFPDVQGLDSVVFSDGPGSDCNANGIQDALEISSGALLDLDDNGTPDICQALSATGASLSASAGGQIPLSLKAGTSNANRVFFLLGSLSGTNPGIPIDAVLLPLQFDAYLQLTLNGQGLPQPSVGLLNASGQAGSSLLASPGLIPSALIGQTVHHAYLAIDPATLLVSLASNALPTLLIP